MSYLTTEFGTRNCEGCEELLEHGTKSFDVASSSWRGNIHFRGLCIDCLLGQVYLMSGKKHLKKKVWEKVIAKDVARKV